MSQELEMLKTIIKTLDERSKFYEKEYQKALGQLQQYEQVMAELAITLAAVKKELEETKRK